MSPMKPLVLVTLLLCSGCKSDFFVGPEQSSKLQELQGMAVNICHDRSMSLVAVVAADTGQEMSLVRTISVYSSLGFAGPTSGDVWKVRKGCLRYLSEFKWPAELRPQSIQIQDVALSDLHPEDADEQALFVISAPDRIEMPMERPESLRHSLTGVVYSDSSRQFFVAVFQNRIDRETTAELMVGTLAGGYVTSVIGANAITFRE